MIIKKIIGIDPGHAGGIAIITKDNYEFHKMPVITTVSKTKFKDSVCKKTGQLIRKYRSSKKTDVEGLNKIISENKEGAVVYLESVSAWVSDTDKSVGKQFGIEKLVKNHEAIKTVCLINGIPLISISSRSWQSPNKLTGMSKIERKGMLKSIAQTKFPSDKMTLQNCDAYLIAHHGLTKISQDKKGELLKAGLSL